MTDTLKIALPQIAPIWLNRLASLEKMQDYVARAATQKSDLIVFGEGAVPGYPFWLDNTGGARFDDPMQKELFAFYSIRR